jgi:hypothetical protein
MNEALDQLDNFEQKPAELPVFLKVLCILTFVGSGWGLLSGLFNVVMVDSSRELLETANRFSDGIYDRMGFDIDEMIRWTNYSNYANLLGSALCLTGALLMWKLKKVGFYLYVPGNLIPLIVSFFAVNYMMGSGPFASLGMIGVVFGSLFSLAFIVMYGVNFKHLR